MNFRLLANPTDDKDAISRVYGDGRYVKKRGDTMTGALSVPNFSRSQPYLQKRHNVLNYYGLVNIFFHDMEEDLVM